MAMLAKRDAAAVIATWFRIKVAGSSFISDRVGRRVAKAQNCTGYMKPARGVDIVYRYIASLSTHLMRRVLRTVQPYDIDHKISAITHLTLIVPINIQSTAFGFANCAENTNTFRLQVASDSTANKVRKSSGESDVTFSNW